MGDKCYAKRRTYAVMIESALDTGNWAWMRYPKNSANLKSEGSARPGPNLKQHRRQIWHMPCVHIRAFYLIISTSSLSIGRISICSEYYVNWHKSLINKSLAHPPHLNHFFPPVTIVLNAQFIQNCLLLLIHHVSLCDMAYDQWVVIHIINSFKSANIKVQNAKLEW